MADKFSHFTPLARTALALAESFAQEVNHRLIDPAHLWIGLWVVEGSASAVLRKIEGMDYLDLQQLVLGNLQGGVLQTSGTNLPRELTAASKAALEYAVDQARRLHHRQISTGHLLLGLLDLRDPISDAILNRLIISPHELVRRLKEAIDSCIIPDDRVELSMGESSTTPFFVSLKQWFGLMPKPARRPAPAPKTLRQEPITVAFLRESVRYSEQLWLLNYAARMFDEVYDDASALECYALILKVCPPTSPRLSVVLSRGIAYTHHQDFDSALVEFNKAIQIASNNVWGYTNRGYIWYRLEQYDKAIEDHTRAILLDPNNITPLYNRALAYQATDQFDLALTDFTAVLKLNDNDVKSWIARGYLHRRLGDRAAALSDAATAQRLAPDDYRPHHLSGHVYSDAYEIEAARAAYTEALRLKPNDHTLMRHQAWLYRMQNDFGKSIDGYTQMIERYPEEYEPYLERALTYIEMAEYYIAAVDLRSAQQIKPEEGIQVEAWLHYKRGDYPAGIQAATTAIDKEPKNADGYFTMACIMEAQGNQSEALHYFKLALEHWMPFRRTFHDPDYRQATEYVANHDSNTSNAGLNATP